MLTFYFVKREEFRGCRLFYAVRPANSGNIGKFRFAEFQTRKGASKADNALSRESQFHFLYVPETLVMKEFVLLERSALLQFFFHCFFHPNRRRFFPLPEQIKRVHLLAHDRKQGRPGMTNDNQSVIQVPQPGK